MNKMAFQRCTCIMLSRQNSDERIHIRATTYVFVTVTFTAGHWAVLIGAMCWCHWKSRNQLQLTHTSTSLTKE